MTGSAQGSNRETCNAACTCSVSLRDGEPLMLDRSHCPIHARADQRPPSIREVAFADAEYVLRWLRQSEAPENIVKLQERATAYLGVASGR